MARTATKLPGEKFRMYADEISALERRMRFACWNDDDPIVVGTIAGLNRLGESLLAFAIGKNREEAERAETERQPLFAPRSAAPSPVEDEIRQLVETPEPIGLPPKPAGRDDGTKLTEADRDYIKERLPLPGWDCYGGPGFDGALFGRIKARTKSTARRLADSLFVEAVEVKAEDESNNNEIARHFPYKRCGEDRKVVAVILPEVFTNGGRKEQNPEDAPAKPGVPTDERQSWSIWECHDVAENFCAGHIRARDWDHAEELARLIFVDPVRIAIDHGDYQHDGDFRPMGKGDQVLATVGLDVHVFGTDGRKWNVGRITEDGPILEPLAEATKEKQDEAERSRQVRENLRIVEPSNPEQRTNGEEHQAKRVHVHPSSDQNHDYVMTKSPRGNGKGLFKIMSSATPTAILGVVEANDIIEAKTAADVIFTEKRLSMWKATISEYSESGVEVGFLARCGGLSGFGPDRKTIGCVANGIAHERPWEPQPFDLRAGQVIRTSYNTGPYEIVKVSTEKAVYCGACGRSHEVAEPVYSMSVIDLRAMYDDRPEKAREGFINGYRKVGGRYLAAEIPCGRAYAPPYQSKEDRKPDELFVICDLGEPARPAKKQRKAPSLRFKATYHPTPDALGIDLGEVEGASESEVRELLPAIYRDQLVNVPIPGGEAEEVIDPSKIKIVRVKKSEDKMKKPAEKTRAFEIIRNNREEAGPAWIARIYQMETEEAAAAWANAAIYRNRGEGLFTVTETSAKYKHSVDTNGGPVRRVINGIGAICVVDAAIVEVEGKFVDKIALDQAMTTTLRAADTSDGPQGYYAAVVGDTKEIVGLFRADHDADARRMASLHESEAMPKGLTVSDWKRHESEGVTVWPYVEPADDPRSGDGPGVHLARDDEERPLYTIEAEDRDDAWAQVDEVDAKRPEGSPAKGRTMILDKLNEADLAKLPASVKPLKVKPDPRPGRREPELPIIDMAKILEEAAEPNPGPQHFAAFYGDDAGPSYRLRADSLAEAQTIVDLRTEGDPDYRARAITPAEYAGLGEEVITLDHSGREVDEEEAELAGLEG